MTLLTPLHLLAVAVLWYITGGFVTAVDAVAARTRRERLAAAALSAAFAVLAAVITWGLVWAAARARAGT